jgi:Acyl-CoA carboxylase epsilon subunit
VIAVPGSPRGAAAPALAIVVGRPTAAETAAVAVVLSAVARRAQAPVVADATRSQWSARSRLLRGPVLAGPDAWRASALPR